MAIGENTWIPSRDQLVRSVCPHFERMLPMKSPLRYPLATALLSLSLAMTSACSGGDGDGADNNSEDGHANHENHSENHAENHQATPEDMGDGEEDMSPADEDMAAPVEDMGASNSMDMSPADEDMNSDDDMAAACDPDATSASLVAVHDEPSTTQTAVFTELPAEGDDGSAGWRLELDAALGGAAEAAEASFFYVDLEHGELLELSDVAAHTDDRWDIAFKRTEIRVNSEDSGPGNWLIADVDAESFEVAAPPSPQEGAWRGDDFVSDTCEVATFGRGTVETAFGQWYDYDPATHRVSAPEGRVYFFYNAATHAVIKLQIESYSDAVYTLRWE